jgi:sulfotransferase
MPRSGSELLQVILHQNPRIYGSSTSPLLEYQFGARANYDLPEVKAQNSSMMFEAFINVCKGIAESYYSAITDSPVIIDKNRGWAHYYEWVEQWNPNPKIICMVRDLRSILASMERIYRQNRHNPQGIDDPVKIANMTVEQRLNHWLNTQPVGLALQRTLDIFQKGLQDKIHFVKFEDLTHNPKEVLNGIYDFIEEEPYEHNFNSIVKWIEEDDSHFGIFGRHSVKSQIEPSSAAPWSDMISPELAEAIRKGNQWYFNAFSY